MPVILTVRITPRTRVVEQFVLNPLIVGSSNTERYGPVNILDDIADAILNSRERSIESYGHISAADVKADTGNADLFFIGDHATYRLSITQMTVSADNSCNRIAD